MITYEIFLEDFEFETIIGILPQEREKPQRIRIDACFVYEGEILDYRLLRDFIKESFTSRFGTLEEALEYFKNTIPKHFPSIKSFKIKITKLEIFEDCKVALQIEHCCKSPL